MRRALQEDLGELGDRTTAAVLNGSSNPSMSIEAWLVSREPTVVAGMPLVAIVFDELRREGVGEVTVEPHRKDGGAAEAGSVLAHIKGSAANILAGERVMLNLVARMCGIASLTRAAVDEVRGTGCGIVDTRKTTAGLRALEKYAVRAGGGQNHRMGLHDMLMIKDNHKRLAQDLRQALQSIERSGESLADAQVEIESMDEIETALDAGCGWLMFDNMTVDQVRRGVATVRGRAKIEVSGGLFLGRLRQYAETGIDRISLGMLTHSARSIDLGLDLDPPHAADR